MIDLEDSVFIHQPITKVFEYVTNFENYSRWQTGIVTTEVTSTAPFGFPTRIVPIKNGPNDWESIPVVVS